MAASLMTLPDALAALASALGAAQKDPTIGTDALTGLYKELLGRAPDAGGLKFWQDALASGVSLESIRADFIKGWEYQSLHPPGFAAGGDHVGGLRIVGENGPELEATGPARIFNASQTKSMIGGGNAELVAEVRALRAAVEKLQGPADRTAASSEDSTKLFKRVIRNDKLYVEDATA